MTEPTIGGLRARLQHHREVLSAAKDASPAERRAILAAMQHDKESRRHAQRAQLVPRWLARRGARRAVATVAAVPFACGMVSAFLTPESLPSIAAQVAGLVGLAAGLTLLRRVTRLLTEVPESDLDERELGERDRALGAAYTILLCGVFVLALAALADGPWLDVRAWEPMILGTLFTAWLLPSAAAAWRWNDLDDEDL